MNANKRKILEDAGILYPSVVTNADRIRNMTDEELAKFFDSEACLFPWCDMSCGDVEEIPCRKCMLKWLKQEVET